MEAKQFLVEFVQVIVNRQPPEKTARQEVEGECVCVYYCRTFYKAVRVGEEESGGHVL